MENKYNIKSPYTILERNDFRNAIEHYKPVQGLEF